MASFQWKDLNKSLIASKQWRIQKILVGGGFEAKTSTIRMCSPKLRLISRKFKRIFRPKSGGLQKKKKKKKKKVFTKIETDFSAGFVTFRSVGGDASRNGAELFKIEADFSAKIVTFRLVGGDAPPPLNPPLLVNRPSTTTFLKK